MHTSPPNRPTTRAFLRQGACREWRLIKAEHRQIQRLVRSVPRSADLSPLHSAAPTRSALARCFRDTEHHRVC
ncbi:hypothetical protein, partial [Prosthecobacter sp.]|uniref:hypothetical protein n=1 Tax=Prosthecobacter sp. TaxID=1965333 RepID=UPI0024894558